MTTEALRAALKAELAALRKGTADAHSMFLATIAGRQAEIERLQTLLDTFYKGAQCETWVRRP